MAESDNKSDKELSDEELSGEVQISVGTVLNAFENYSLGFEGGKRKKKPARKFKNQVNPIFKLFKSFPFII